MAFSNETIKEMHDRLQELEYELLEVDRRKARITTAIAGLKAVLAAEGVSPTPALNGASLAGQIREALRAIGRPASPSEIAWKLQEDGLTWDQGDAKLVHAVNSALFKMAKSNTGGVTRPERGKYTIKEGQ